MKNQIYLLLLFFGLSGISSCVFYNTVELNKLSEESITEVSYYKTQLTLSINNTNKIFDIVNHSVRNDSLFGDLKMTSYLYHDPHQKRFRRKSNKAAMNYFHLYTSEQVLEGPLAIPISAINKASVHEVDVLLSTVSTITAAVGLTVIGVTGFLIIACACPHVETVAVDGTIQKQGSLFPGAIFRTLERNDHLILKELGPNSSGYAEFYIRNELPEIHFIDQIKLKGVKHARQVLGLLPDAKLVSYNKNIRPSIAIDQSGKNVLAQVLSSDGLSYDFSTGGSYDSLHSMELHFDKNEPGENLLLTLRAKQTERLEKTVELFFMQFGRSFSKWVEYKNDDDPEVYKNYAIKQGITLNAYIMHENSWKYVGSFENAGTTSYRDLALKLPPELLSMQKIRIRLECAEGFWNIDGVAISEDWTTKLDITEFPLFRAVDENGNQVDSLITNSDQLYRIHPQKGNFTHLLFKIPVEFTGTYVLFGEGYYNQQRNYTHAPNRKALRFLKETPYSSQYLSRTLAFNELLERLSYDN